MPPLLPFPPLLEGAPGSKGTGAALEIPGGATRIGDKVGTTTGTGAGVGATNGTGAAVGEPTGPIAGLSTGLGGGVEIPGGEARSGAGVGTTTGTGAGVGTVTGVGAGTITGVGARVQVSAGLIAGLSTGVGGGVEIPCGETRSGAGVGTNLIIVWGKGGMGNVEYAAAFSEVVLPILCSFKPDLIMIACGLDAAEGDLLGDCGVSPDMYYTMTESILTAMPNTPLVVALEGGYNIDVSANCMEKVALALFEEARRTTASLLAADLDKSSSSTSVFSSSFFDSSSLLV